MSITKEITQLQITNLVRSEFNEMAAKNGSVTHDGIDYAQLEQAYRIGINQYMATAVSLEMFKVDHCCADDEFVDVFWDIIDINCDDESNACDWGNPSSIVNDNGTVIK